MKGPSPLKKNLEKIGTKWQQKRRKYFTRAGLSLISLEPFCLRKLVLGFVCVASGTVVAIVLNDGDLFVHLRSHMRVCMCFGAWGFRGLGFRKMWFGRNSEVEVGLSFCSRFDGVGWLKLDKIYFLLFGVKGQGDLPCHR